MNEPWKGEPNRQEWEAHGLSNAPDAIYRDMAYVTRETEYLAKQAAEVLA